MGSNNIIYGINDKPKFGLAVLLGMQHVFTLFGATTLVPLILGGAIFGNDNAAMANFVGNVYLGMGIATLLQLYAGSGLPIIQGSSFAFLTPFFAIIAIVKTCGGGGAEIMQALAGALIAGGLIETVLGYTGFVGRLKKIITPVVIGPTIMLIGFSLFDIAVGSNAAKYWPVSLLVVALIFFFSLIAKGKTRLFPVLLSIIISYVICLILSALNVFEQGHPAYVNLDAVKNSDWFRMPVLFPYGRPHFNPSAIFAVLAAFLASIIESIGDYHSVSYAAGLKDPEPKTISKGIGAEGLGCVINGLFGGAATTSYTENIGLINITKVASRYVVLIAAVILICLSFFSKLGALIATMPSPIIGGAYIALFGVIGALGIQVLSKCDLKSQRNLMIIGFAFIMGLGVGKWMPDYYKTNACLLGENGVGKICWDIIGAILSTPMGVGAICALLLDNIIPGSNEERGLNPKN